MPKLHKIIQTKIYFNKKNSEKNSFPGIVKSLWTKAIEL